MALARTRFRLGDTLLKGDVKTLTFETARQRAEVLYSIIPPERPSYGVSETVKAVITVRSKAGEPLAVIQTTNYGARYLHGNLVGALKEAGFGAMAKAVTASIPS